MNTKAAATNRRYDLDWMRVLAILSVFIFHSSRFFDTLSWHVKNPLHLYPIVTAFINFMVNWMMPLVFVISGASLFYALGKGGAGKFIKDKVLRLLVPLVVGVFTHCALQVYLESRTQGGYRGSFFDFLPHYFQGWREFGGNFAWTGMHLWYLEVLFILCIIFLPLFIWLKRGSGQRLLGWLGNLLAKPGAIYLFVLPTTLMVNLLDLLKSRSFLMGRGFGGWPVPLYITFFLSGFVIISSEKLQKSIQRLRWLSLAIGLTLNIVRLYKWGPSGDTLFDLPTWFMLLGILGFGMKHLNFNTPLLQYANEAVLPFYIMHQTVLLGVGYFIVQWHIPDILKWAAIAAISFASIMGLYEILVRRINVLRTLFGMKPIVIAPAAQPREIPLINKEGEIA